MEEKVINAEVRTETGKNVNRRLRDNGFIPAVLYSHGEAEVLSIGRKDFNSLFHNQISESVIFGLNIKGGKDSDTQAFVKEYQVDPVSGEIIHLDLFKVTKGEKIHTIVPIELSGTPAGIKAGGQLDIGDREINIVCLPKDLPEKIVVDVSGMNIDDTIHAGDLELAEGIILESNEDALICSVIPTRIVEIEPEAGEEEDVEAAADEESEEESSEE